MSKPKPLHELKDREVIVGAVASACADELPHAVILSALTLAATSPWGIDAAIDASVKLQDIQKEHRNRST